LKEGVGLPFTGIPTFCKFPLISRLEGMDVDVAIIGVPLDLGTTNRTGARYGPRAIRDGSQIYANVMQPELGVYDVELGRYKLAKTRIADHGDVSIAPTSCEENLDPITHRVREILRHRAFPVVLGGDHSVTYPVIRAYKNVALDIVHFDTHMDFADELMGTSTSHASPIKRASELENVGEITQIGIRGLLNPKDLFVNQAKKRGARVVTATEAIRLGSAWVLKQIPKAENLYVTIDIDALDPSVAPGTGTPEPGGFTYLQMKEMLAGVAEKGRIIGFDLVEVNPLYDPAGITAQLAARLILDFLGVIRERERRRGR